MGARLNGEGLTEPRAARSQSQLPGGSRALFIFVHSANTSWVPTMCLALCGEHWGRGELDRGSPCPPGTDVDKSTMSTNGAK